MFDSLYQSRRPRKSATHAKCTHCGKEFGAASSRVKTCSEACKAARALVGGQVNAERARLRRLAKASDGDTKA